MPENTRPPRWLYDPDTRPTLGARAFVMRAVEDLAAAWPLPRARVTYRRNEEGEHAVFLAWRAE